MARWQESLERLDAEHGRMLEGGALSGLFLRYPLGVANPILVGGFYGLLISIALIPLSAYFGNIEDWPEQALSLIVLTSLLGGASLLYSMALKRPPTRLEDRRRYLFPFPFLGLLVLGIEEFYDLGGMFARLGMALLVLPGPVYVHVSYAPRWRILSRLEREMAPFEGMRRTIQGGEDGGVGLADSDLDEVVGDALL
ncbi:MAG: hypothetical protein QF545_03315 [Candidatus Thalassarchaeaceae archaeon]|nr:hypothetical protein [Candidatus Thalassarchaeaceae archaeon]MDP7004556.1 hypothetical protein [Candidatus Thalassarchaeaceae archaeon]